MEAREDLVNQGVPVSIQVTKASGEKRYFPENTVVSGAWMA
jgi:hypothetical protein